MWLNERDMVRTFAILGSLLLVLGVFALRTSSFYMSAGRDGGIMAYLGEQVAEGKVLYRDLWEHKPPLLHIVTALLFAVFPPTFATLAVFETLWLLAGMWVVFLLTKKLTPSPTAPWIASLLFGIHLGTMRILENLHMTESYALVVAATAILCLIHALCDAKRPTIWLLASGMFSGAAALFRIPAASIVVPAMLYLCLADAVSREGYAARARNIGSYLLGILFTFLAVIAFFFAQGAAD